MNTSMRCQAVLQCAARSNAIQSIQWILLRLLLAPRLGGGGGILVISSTSPVLLRAPLQKWFSQWVWWSFGVGELKAEGFSTHLMKVQIWSLPWSTCSWLRIVSQSYFFPISFDLNSLHPVQWCTRKSILTNLILPQLPSAMSCSSSRGSSRSRSTPLSLLPPPQFSIPQHNPYSECCCSTTSKADALPCAKSLLRVISHGLSAGFKVPWEMADYPSVETPNGSILKLQPR